MSSFFLTQFLVLNLDGLFDSSFNRFAIFDIQLLYCYTNLNLSIICCLSFVDVYLIFLMLPLIYTYFLGTNLNSSIISSLSSEDMYLFYE